MDKYYTVTINGHSKNVPSIRSSISYNGGKTRIDIYSTEAFDKKDVIETFYPDQSYDQVLLIRDALDQQD